MTQHAAFVMNISVRFGDTQRRVVMCRACGHQRPRMLADHYLEGMSEADALAVAKMHNDSNIVTDALGKAV